MQLSACQPRDYFCGGCSFSPATTSARRIQLARSEESFRVSQCSITHHRRATALTLSRERAGRLHPRAIPVARCTYGPGRAGTSDRRASVSVQYRLSVGYEKRASVPGWPMACPARRAPATGSSLRIAAVVCLASLLSSRPITTTSAPPTTTTTIIIIGRSAAPDQATASSPRLHRAGETLPVQ